MLNINRSDDEYYRYKMPKILTKIEGKGNGIKTVITNMTDVAKALNRKSSYPTKYFGCECGAQVQMDEKNDRYIVNGVHEAGKLQELLYGFIQKYVLCSSCGNPETVLSVKKRSSTLAYRCKACGHRGEMASSHRLTQYILKNPPEADTDEMGATNEADEKDDNAQNAQTNGDNSTNVDPVEIDLINDVKADVPDEDVNWSVEPSNEAMEQRIRELANGAKNLSLLTVVNEQDNNIIRTESERADDYMKVVKEMKKNKADDKALTDQQVEYLLKTKESLQLRENALYVIAEGLLADPNRIKEDISLYRPVLYPLTRNEKAQRILIHCFEFLIANNHSKLLDDSPFILKTFYDEDLLEEALILSWHKKGPSKRNGDKKVSTKLHAKVKPFIEWLESAEEESSDEGAGQENEDDNSNDKDANDTTGSAACAFNESDESDVDIDNI